MEIPDDVFDSIDGKSTIYTDFLTIESQDEGDLLIPTVSRGKPYEENTYWFYAGRIYRCSTTRDAFIPTDWTEVVYTDDTRANEAAALADEAKRIGNTLVNGLGFQQTEIGESYVISPVIAGGHLLIGDETGVYAKIDIDGKLYCSGADISGTVHVEQGDLIIGNESGTVVDGKTVYNYTKIDGKNLMLGTVQRYLYPSLIEMEFMKGLVRIENIKKENFNTI
jgi:hypothetical protein